MLQQNCVAILVMPEILADSNKAYHSEDPQKAKDPVSLQMAPHAWRDEYLVQLATSLGAH